MRAVKSVTIDSERRVIITFLDGSTETLYPNLICCDAEVISALRELADTKATAIYETVSGEIVSFSDGADDMPLKSCVVSIEPIQEGTGDPSPENVRPISGRTGLTVHRSGSDISNPTEFPVTWESEVGTVYGGYVDVVSGKLMVNRSKVTYNGSESWESRSASYGFYTRVLLDNSGAIGQISLSNFLKWNNKSAPANLAPGEFLLGMYLNVRPQDITNVTDWKDYLAINNLEVCYPLATPTEIQLTPQEVRTLLGANNIWSDTGYMNVEYPADTKMYIEKLTAPTEDDMIADHEILTNRFFMVGNTLYRAITTIASGATITPGTNAVKLSLSDALNALA